jgi:hypothetical protein
MVGASFVLVFGLTSVSDTASKTLVIFCIIEVIRASYTELPNLLEFPG